MLLSSLFEGSPDIEIKQLSIDSRLPMKDCIFFCLSGIRYNGHDYIKEAIKNGATVIVYEEDIDTSLDAVFIKVSNVEDCLNDIAVRFYNYPAKDLDTYVCAGCDGPSSVSYLLRALIENYKPCASIGVFGILYGEHRLYSSVPTLTILDNQKYLNEFRKQGMKACVFEADALSLSYKKLDSVSPDVFIYCSTNENSGEFQEIGINYYDVLCSYLYTLNDDTAIVLNRDDHSYDELIKATGDNFATYGFSSDSDFMIRNMELDRNGSSFDLCHDDETVHIKTRLLGINNVYNCTAALSALYMQGYELSELAAYLETIEPLAGVMEPVVCGQKYEVIVDCADNIANIHDVYEFASNVSSSASKIVCVWGLNSQDEKENLRD
ncbi:MAG: hypothetical protein IKF68_06045, partial [Erysipelotrichaceae bacterium]|nr:hypothetical protein [Erysipelotrichaceae bacterium]